MGLNSSLDIRARVRRWLDDAAMPFWLANGLDRQAGGFVERFSLNGEPQDPGFKRCRVMGRQLYVFSHASLLGYTDARNIADRGGIFFLDKFHLGDGRWARRASRSGEPIDMVSDLYDIAFVLFALGWWCKASGDRKALSMARQTLETTRRELRHPSGEGYLHEAGASAPYQQNPHMHLLEAMLVLAEVSGDSFFFEEAERLYSLALGRFIAGQPTLAELFDDGWARPISNVRVEPGHHFEWTWLLKRYADLGGSRDALSVARTLFDFAMANGVDLRTRLVYDSIDDEGRPTETDHRIWGQLECVKAFVAMSEIGGFDAREPTEKIGAAIFDHYLDPAHPGLWFDHLSRDLTPRVAFAPTSTFYHVFLAFSELPKAWNCRSE